MGVHLTSHGGPVLLTTQILEITFRSLGLSSKHLYLLSHPASTKCTHFKHYYPWVTYLKKLIIYRLLYTELINNPNSNITSQAT